LKYTARNTMMPIRIVTIHDEYFLKNSFIF